MLAQQTSLSTTRLRLRPWQPADAPVLLALIEAARARLLPDFPQTTATIQDAESAADFIAEQLRDWATRTGFQLSIWEKASGACLGVISFTNIDWLVPKTEIACWVAAGAEGRGLMAEAGRAAIGWAFRQLGMERIYCHANPQNTRSLVLSQRLGLQPEGLLRRNFRDGDGIVTDSVVSGMIRVDFFARPPEETA